MENRKSYEMTDREREILLRDFEIVLKVFLETREGVSNV